MVWVLTIDPLAEAYKLEFSTQYFNVFLDRDGVAGIWRIAHFLLRDHNFCIAVAILAFIFHASSSFFFRYRYSSTSYFFSPVFLSFDVSIVNLSSPSFSSPWSPSNRLNFRSVHYHPAIFFQFERHPTVRWISESVPHSLLKYSPPMQKYPCFLVAL